MTDEDLNRICDERAGGPFMRVTLDDLTLPAPHVNETPKTEHVAGNVLTDAALIARLREIQGQAGLFASAAADRIEALVKERDDLIHDLERIKDSETEQLNRVKRLEAALSAAKEYIEELEWHYGGGETELTRKYRAALEGNTHDA